MLLSEPIEATAASSAAFIINVLSCSIAANGSDACVFL